MLPSFGARRFPAISCQDLSSQAVSIRNDGGRYRIRTYDFHRVNLIGIGFSTTYKYVEVA
jgi:hypothetical protein